MRFIIVELARRGILSKKETLEVAMFREINLAA